MLNQDVDSLKWIMFSELFTKITWLIVITLSLLLKGKSSSIPVANTDGVWSVGRNFDSQCKWTTFHQHLTGAIYLQFVRNTPEDLVRLSSFSYTSKDVDATCEIRLFLNETFPNRWLRRKGPVCWPLRSPNLTSCDSILQPL